MRLLNQQIKIAINIIVRTNTLWEMHTSSNLVVPVAVPTRPQDECYRHWDHHVGACVYRPWGIGSCFDPQAYLLYKLKQLKSVEA